jgi:hypothetical protein
MHAIWGYPLVPFETEAHELISEDLVDTAKKTQHVTISNINSLMLFREIITISSENRTKPTSWLRTQNSELEASKVGGSYDYQ